MDHPDLIPILLAQAWQITLLILAVAGINRWSAWKRPHLAHALWLVVLVKCVTPPLWSSPSGMFCWLQAPRVVEQTGVVPVEQVSRTWDDLLAASRQRSSTVIPDPIELSMPDSDMEPVESVLGFGDDSVVETRPLSVTPTRSWSSVLLGAWLLASLLVISVTVVRFLSCWRLLKRSPQRECPELNALVADLAKRLRLRRRVRLIVTESRLGPAVIGLFRSTVLLPALIVDRLVRSPVAPRQGFGTSLDSDPSETIEGQSRDGIRVAERHGYVDALAPILAHELLHIRRGDLWVGLLQTLAQAVWWCHPLVWWVNRLTTREAERCCDEEVLAELGCDPAAYARALVDVLELKRKLKPVPVFPGVRPVEVTSQRLERIMELGQGCRRRTPWWCWLLAALAAAVTWPGAAFVVTADDAKKTEPPKQIETSTQTIRGVGVNSDAGISGEIIAEDQRKFGVPVEFETVLKSPFIRRNELKLRHGPWTVLICCDKDQQIVIEKENGADHHRFHSKSPARIWIRHDNTADARLHVYAEQFSLHTDKDGHTLELQGKVSVLSTDPNSKMTAMADSMEITLPRIGSERGSLPFELSGSVNIVFEERTQKHKIHAKLAQLVLSSDSLGFEHFDALKHSIEQSDSPREAATPPAKDLELDALGQLLWRHGSWFIVVRPEPGRQLIDGGAIPAKFESNGPVKVMLTNMQVEGFNTKNQLRIAADQFSISSNEHGRTVRFGGDVRLEGHEFNAHADSLVLTLSQNAREDFRGAELSATLSGHVSVKNKSKNDPSELTAEKLILFLKGSAISNLERTENGIVAVLRDPPSQDDVLIRHGKTALAAAAAVKLISVDFKHETLKGAMQQLAEKSGRNIHLDPTGLEEEGLTDKEFVTLKLDGVTLRSALTLALDPLNLGYRVEESGVIVVTSKQRLRGEPTVMTYSVADLVVPIPKRVALELSDLKRVASKPKEPLEISPPDHRVLAAHPQSEEHAMAMQLRFKELIELVTTTCEPNSWAEVGGAGQIKANDSTLSLVVRQTREVHSQIKDLFEQLQRLQNLQASLQVETLTVPSEFWSQVGRDFDIVSTETFPNPQLPPKDAAAPRGVARLSKKEAALLRSVSDPQMLPRVTLFSGQELDLFFGTEPSDMRFAAKLIVSADQKHLRLQYAIQRRDATIDFAKQKLPAVTFEDGQSLLIDVTEVHPTTPKARVPILDKVPGESRLFKNTGKSDHRTLLLITGRVVVIKEETAIDPEVPAESLPSPRIQ